MFTVPWILIVLLLFIIVIPQQRCLNFAGLCLSSSEGQRRDTMDHFTTDDSLSSMR
jgi:hypothetical protein